MKTIPIKIQKKNNILLFSGIPYYRKTNCKLYQKLDDYMDAAQTKTRDFSKYGNHGTVYGAIPSTTEPTGFYFDGTDDYIDCGSDDSLNLTDEITIEAWVKRASVGSWHTIAGKFYNFDAPRRAYLLDINDNDKINFYISSDGGSINRAIRYSSSSIHANTWYHIVGTYDGTNQNVYVNGVLDNGTLTGTVQSSIYSINDPVVIGAESDYDTFFHGTIALVRIYKFLSENAIKSHFENERNIFGV